MCPVLIVSSDGIAHMQERHGEEWQLSVRTIDAENSQAGCSHEISGFNAGRAGKPIRAEGGQTGARDGAGRGGQRPQAQHPGAAAD